MAVITAKWTPGATVAFGSVNTAYTNVVAASGLSIVGLVLCNATDKSVLWSLDGGTTDFLEQPSGTSIPINFGANGVHSNINAYLKRGSGGAPTSGFVSIGFIAGS